VACSYIDAFSAEDAELESLMGDAERPALA
jgi:hypothetical protein